MLGQGRLEEFGPGTVVFRQGETGDRLYIVKSGVLEVLSTAEGGGPDAPPVAYLGEGEVLGELALLTGSPRSATARSPERAEVLTLEKSVFLDLMATPARVRAQPVPGPRPAAGGHDPQGPARDRQAAPGEPEVLRPRHRDPDPHRLAPDGQPAGHPGGRPVRAWRRSSSSRATSPRPGSATCPATTRSSSSSSRRWRASSRSRAKTVPEEEVQTDITMPAISLLMESVRLQDELPLLQEQLPDPAAGLPAEGRPAEVEGGGDRGARGLGVVAPEEGRLARRPAARHAPLLVRDLPDRGRWWSRPDRVGRGTCAQDGAGWRASTLGTARAGERASRTVSCGRIAVRDHPASDRGRAAGRRAASASPRARVVRSGRIAPGSRRTTPLARLVHVQSVSAVSCVATGPHWLHPAGFADLRCSVRPSVGVLEVAADAADGLALGQGQVVDQLQHEPDPRDQRRIT